MLTTVASLIGSAALTQADPPLTVVLEYSTVLYYGWITCAEGESPGAGPEPVCRARSSTEGWVESLAPCAVSDAEIAMPILGQFIVDCTSFHFNSMLKCWSSIRGSCSWAYPGQPYARGVSYTFSRPIWPEFWQGCIDDAGSAPYPRMRIELFGDTGSGCIGPVRFTFKRADFTADGVIDGADLGVLFTFWGQPQWRRADLNDDGAIDGADLAMLFADWGPVSPP